MVESIGVGDTLTWEPKWDTVLWLVSKSAKNYNIGSWVLQNRQTNSVEKKKKNVLFFQSTF